jgi:hypothetical protein
MFGPFQIFAETTDAQDAFVDRTIARVDKLLREHEQNLREIYKERFADNMQSATSRNIWRSKPVSAMM